jgi:hypothetical protein
MWIRLVQRMVEKGGRVLKDAALPDIYYSSAEGVLLLSESHHSAEYVVVLPTEVPTTSAATMRKTPSAGVGLLIRINKLPALSVKKFCLREASDATPQTIGSI